MFGKKPPEKLTQSHLIDGSIIGGQVPIAQADGDRTASQPNHSDDQTQDTTSTEVMKLLEKLQSAVKASDLADSEQDGALDKPAKREAGNENRRDRPLHRELLDYFAETQE